MPGVAAEMPCPFCDKVYRTDRTNRHILKTHQAPANVIGDFGLSSVSLHPTRRKIVVIKNRAGQEIDCYCFECFTKTKKTAGCSPSKAALRHVCVRKKTPPSGPIADDTPHLEITETAAPVAAPAPAPAPVCTIEHHCQAVADYLAEKLGESSYRRRYDAHKVFLEEFDRDDEDESKEAQWSEFLIYLMKVIDDNTTVIQTMKAKAREQSDKIADLNMEVASAKANVKHHMAQHSSVLKECEGYKRDLEELNADKMELERLCRSKGLIP